MNMTVFHTNTKPRKKKPRGKGWQNKVYYQKMKKPEFTEYVAPQNFYRSADHRDKYPSVDSFGSADACSKKEPMKYTGTLIKGIATMHKSNAVPVIDQQQAEDISRMRR